MTIVPRKLGDDLRRGDRVAAMDGDVGSVGGERERDRTADAPRGARHEHRAAGERGAVS